jgi:hypothetical protein
MRCTLSIQLSGNNPALMAACSFTCSGPAAHPMSRSTCLGTTLAVTKGFGNRGLHMTAPIALVQNCGGRGADVGYNPKNRTASR